MTTPFAVYAHGEGGFRAAAAAVEVELSARAVVEQQQEQHQHQHHQAPKLRLDGRFVDVSPHNWLRLDSQGATRLITTGKYKLAMLLGVQPRDLRLLDPRMVAAISPIAILVRENSIVVNLCTLRCIITQDYVLVVNPEDPYTAALVEELQAKLKDPTHLGQVMQQPGMSRLLASSAMQRAQQAGKALGLSFELKVLEIALHKVVSSFSAEARAVQASLLPVLDAMAQRVLVSELEVIRGEQSKLTQLETRLLALKEVVDKFLQNDEWMYKLSLNAVAMAAAGRVSRMGSLCQTPVRGRSHRSSKRASLDGRPGSSSSSSSSSSNSLSPEDQAEVAVVEMMLETYQMQMQKVHNRIKSLNNAIADSQSLVHIRLDKHRNRLTNVDLMLTAFMTSMVIGTSISGSFGVNLWGMDPSKQLALPGLSTFNPVAIVGASLGPMVVVAVLMVLAYRKGWL